MSGTVWGFFVFKCVDGLWVREANNAILYLYRKALYLASKLIRPWARPCFSRESDYHLPSHLLAGWSWGVLAAGISRLSPCHLAILQPACAVSRNARAPPGFLAVCRPPASLQMHACCEVQAQDRGGINFGLMNIGALREGVALKPRASARTDSFILNAPCLGG